MREFLDGVAKARRRPLVLDDPGARAAEEALDHGPPEGADVVGGGALVMRISQGLRLRLEGILAHDFQEQFFVASEGQARRGASPRREVGREPNRGAGEDGRRDGENGGARADNAGWRAKLDPGAIEFDRCGGRRKPEIDPARQAGCNQCAVTQRDAPVVVGRGCVIGAIVGDRDALEAVAVDESADRLNIGVPLAVRRQCVRGAVAHGRRLQPFAPCREGAVRGRLFGRRKAEIVVLPAPGGKPPVDAKSGLLGDARPGVAASRMQPSAPEIERHARDVASESPPSNPRARLDDPGSKRARARQPRRGDAGGAGADDHDIDISFGQWGRLRPKALIWPFACSRFGRALARTVNCGRKTHDAAADPTRALSRERAENVMSFILAIDQGTTSTRAIVFHASLRPVAISQQEFPQCYPPSGWVEHDPAALWRTVVETARAALAKSGAGARDLAGVGITNQRETALVWDRATGKPIHNAIVWQDRRTVDTCARLRAEGREPEVADRKSTRLNSSH